MCKKCKKAFRKVSLPRRLPMVQAAVAAGREWSHRIGLTLLILPVCVPQDMTTYEDSDEYCPHCTFLISVSSLSKPLFGSVR